VLKRLAKEPFPNWPNSEWLQGGLLQEEYFVCLLPHRAPLTYSASPYACCPPESSFAYGWHRWLSGLT